MEALVAVGLASNVLQFVSFGADLLSETRQIHSSVSGTTREFEDIEGVCRHVEELCAGLSPAPVPGSAPTKEEATLLSLASKCRSAAQDLAARLQTLRRRDAAPGSRTKLASLRSALRANLGKRRVKELQRSLDGYRGELMECLVGMLGSVPPSPVPVPGA